MPTTSVAAARRWRREHVQARYYAEDDHGPNAEWIEGLYQFLLPVVANVITGFLVNEGMTKVQALEGYKVTAFALMHGLNEAFPGEFTEAPKQPQMFQDLLELGAEAWIERYWSNGSAAG